MQQKSRSLSFLYTFMKAAEGLCNSCFTLSGLSLQVYTCFPGLALVSPQPPREESGAKRNAHTPSLKASEVGLLFLQTALSDYIIFPSSGG